MQKIVTNLWFDGRLEEALAFYERVFPEFNLTGKIYYGDENPEKKGQAVTATFELFGQAFTIINGGPGFPQTEAVSLQVNCADQAEVDHYWEKLSDGGQESQCGWLKDPFGVSWQVIPARMDELLMDKDPEKSQRVMNAMLKMTKIDLAILEAAYNGE
ncbi:MAG: VOC family protein [Chloroflexota bacterium]